MKSDQSTRPTLQRHAGPDGAVVASLEEIRRAEQLRARLREMWLRNTSAAIPTWCISAD